MILDSTELDRSWSAAQADRTPFFHLVDDDTVDDADIEDDDDEDDEDDEDDGGNRPRRARVERAIQRRGLSAFHRPAMLTTPSAGVNRS